MTVKSLAVSVTVAIAVLFGSMATALPLQGYVHRLTRVLPVMYAAASQHDHAANPRGANPGVAHPADPKNYRVAQASYVPPDVTLMDRHGKPVQLAAILEQRRPVLLEFVFTSCTTICPILSATFSQAQQGMSKVSPDYLMISISIDPEYDTPARLDAYARRYHPGKNWLFLTGKRKDIHRVLKAFDALYQSDNKMYHRPYIFVRSRSGPSWLRLEGYPSSHDLLNEYRRTENNSAGGGR